MSDYPQGIDRLMEFVFDRLEERKMTEAEMVDEMSRLMQRMAELMKEFAARQLATEKKLRELITGTASDAAP